MKQVHDGAANQNILEFWRCAAYSQCKSRAILKVPGHRCRNPHLHGDSGLSSDRPWLARIDTGMGDAPPDTLPSRRSWSESRRGDQEIERGRVAAYLPGSAS